MIKFMLSLAFLIPYLLCKHFLKWLVEWAAALILLALIIFFWACATIPKLPILIPVYITSKFTDKTRILGVDVHWHGWARNMFLSDDQAANATLGGSMDNTCSSRIGHNAARGSRIALKMELLTDMYFRLTTGQKNHCRVSIERDEKHNKNWGA